MQFLSILILLAPAMVNAIPTVSEHDTASDALATYTFVMPSEYVAANPGTPAAIEFNQEMLDEFATIFPVQVTSTNEVIVSGEVDLSNFENISFEGASTEGWIKKLKCVACKGACIYLTKMIDTCSECFFIMEYEWFIEANGCVVSNCNDHVC
jgi:hypothetical protein